MSDDVPIDPEILLRLQKLAALGEASAGVSHETRNLLTAIVGFAQLARKRGSEPDEPLRYVGLIEREAVRCIDLLERFLDLSRVNSAQLELVEIAKVIERVATVTKYRSEIQRVTMRIEAPASLRVRSHRGELEQVVLNLVNNALDAMPSGGDIAITAVLAGGTIELAVADSGPGVPHELREKIFEAFCTTKAEGKGTGLGLALSRKIVGANGGTLELDATTATGARFVARLPAS